MLLLVAFVLVGCSAASAELLSSSGSSAWSPGAAGAVAVGALLLVFTVPTHGLPTRGAHLDAAGDIRSQVVQAADRVPRRVPVRMRFDTVGWTQPYPYVVAAALDEAGIDIVVEEPFMVRMYGADRAAGEGNRAEVVVQLGDAAPPRRARTLAFVPDPRRGARCVSGARQGSLTERRTSRTGQQSRGSRRRSWK